MSKKKLIVVGAGLCGSFAAHVAEHMGYAVTVIDAEREGRASPASAGLTKIGDRLWEDCQEVFNLLGVGERVTMHNPDGKDMERYIVRPTEVLWPTKRTIRQEVLEVGDGWVCTRGGKVRGNVLVASGVWTPELLPEHCPEVARKVGVALYYRGQVPQAEYIPYAPYKHLTVYNFTDSVIYFSTGVSILHKNWTAEYQAKVMEHADNYGLKRKDLIHTTAGLRPYVDGGPWFQRCGQRLWGLTGAAKNGVVTGASCAKKLMLEIDT